MSDAIWDEKNEDRKRQQILHSYQVRALQGVMMSGVALWTTDIGGYSGGDPKDPEFQVETCPKISKVSGYLGCIA